MPDQVILARHPPPEVARVTLIEMVPAVGATVCEAALLSCRDLVPLQLPATLLTVAVTLRDGSNSKPVGARRVITPVPISPETASVTAGPVSGAKVPTVRLPPPVACVTVTAAAASRGETRTKASARNSAATLKEDAWRAREAPLTPCVLLVGSIRSLLRLSESLPGPG